MKSTYGALEEGGVCDGLSPSISQISTILDACVCIGRMHRIAIASSVPPTFRALLLTNLLPVPFLLLLLLLLFHFTFLDNVAIVLVPSWQFWILQCFVRVVVSKFEMWRCISGGMVWRRIWIGMVPMGSSAILILGGHFFVRASALSNHIHLVQSGWNIPHSIIQRRKSSDWPILLWNIRGLCNREIWCFINNTFILPICSTSSTMIEESNVHSCQMTRRPIETYVIGIDQHLNWIILKLKFCFLIQSINWNRSILGNGYLIP